MSTLYLIRGLPGSGKSTMVERLNVQHVEADMFHITEGVYRFDAARIAEAHAWCQSRTRQMLADGDVAVSNTFTRRWELAPYYEMHALGLCKRVVEITVDTLLTDTELAARTLHAVPVETIKAMRERWESAVAVPPETPRPDLLKFITEKRDEAVKHVRQRLDAQHSWRSGTEADYKASHKLAERMHGRKMPYMNAAQREETAAREERIGAKYQREADLYDAVIVALSVESVPPAPKPKESEVQIAERIARGAHEGQKDTVSGWPYITHVERVVARVEGDDAKSVAWLHDVLEDCDEWTYDDLMREGISQRVCDAVAALTREPQISYAEYIEQIRVDSNPLVIAVKLADLRDHMHPTCPERLRPRYEAALKSLAPPAPKGEK